MTNKTCTVNTCDLPPTFTGTLTVQHEANTTKVGYCDEHAEGFRKLARENAGFITVKLERVNEDA